MNASKTDNPGNTIGDTWAQIQGKFLLGAIRSSEIGSTGGEATHTLTIDEMPEHKHYIGAHGGNQYFSNVPFEEDHVLTYMNGQNLYYQSSNEGGGATSQQYATLSSRCYLGENSLAFLLEVL